MLTKKVYTMYTTQYSTQYKFQYEIVEIMSREDRL